MKLSISKKQAVQLLGAGKDRATGIIVSLPDVHRIMGGESLGLKTMFAALPSDVAIRTNSVETAGDDAIVFSKKKLEDIQYGVYKDDSKQRE
ncbi:MAG: hypothetical protein ACN2B6_03075 [Rickettsiales bacterium]